MRIPEYVKNIMRRASYNYEKELKGFAVGYTINIAKETPCQHLYSLEKDINRFVSWCNREYYRRVGSNELEPVAYINYIPCRTRYVMQHITVTVNDPIMKKIEEFIPER